MNKERNLPLQLARHHVHDVLLLQGGFVGPEVVKPLEHSPLDVCCDFPEIIKLADKTSFHVSQNSFVKVLSLKGI